jgi:membrane-associated protease RseP (regulator of RpoE activity)
VIARAHNLKVKSSGFAFLGLIVPILPAAFVEPDEKELRKRPHKQQLSVFAAGPFSNIAFAFLFLAIASFMLAPLANAVIEPNGVKVTDYVKEKDIFPAEKAGIKIGEVIQKVDNVPTPYVNNLSFVLKSKKPNDVVSIKTDKSVYEIRLAKNPENSSMAYLGAYLEQGTKINDDVKASFGEFLPNALIWVYGLFVILVILNFGIGLFNLVPLGPLDGGRMLQLVLHKIFDEKKGNRIWGYIGLFFMVLIFINIAAGFVR